MQRVAPSGTRGIRRAWAAGRNKRSSPGASGAAASASSRHWGGVRQRATYMVLAGTARSEARANTSSSVKSYNVDMAAAVIAGLPTMLVYVLAGQYFVKGLTAGAVKG